MRHGGTMPVSECLLAAIGVEARACLLEVLEAARNPEPERLEALQDFAAFGGERVLDSRRNLRVDGARDQAIAFQLAQSLREHLLADAVDSFQEPCEAQRGIALCENVERPERPLARDVSEDLAQELFLFDAQLGASQQL